MTTYALCLKSDCNFSRKLSLVTDRLINNITSHTMALKLRLVKFFAESIDDAALPSGTFEDIEREIEFRLFMA